MAEVVLWNGKRVAALPAALAEEIRRMELGNTLYAGVEPGDKGLRIAPPTLRPSPAAVEEAKRLLLHLPRMLSPPDRPDLAKWLAMLNGTVRNPLSEEDFGRRIDALAFVLGELPKAVFTDDTCKSAMKRFDFFPSGAELWAFLDELAAPMRNRVALIRRIAAYEPPPPVSPRAELTDSEKEEVARTVAEYLAEVRASHRDRQPSTLRPMTQDDLRRAYESELLRGDLTDDQRKLVQARLHDLATNLAQGNQ